jgi:predicted flap endonuclease-1-like 5' DNA nuclease
MLTIILASGFWTLFCSWIFWGALLAVGAFILGWLFRTPKIDEWRHKYESEVSKNAGFTKKYNKLEKANSSFNKEKSNYERQIEKQKSELVTLRNKSSKLENDLRATSSDRDRINQKLGLLNSEITSLKGTGEVVADTTDADENVAEIDRLTSILHNRDAEIERMKNSVAEVKAEKDEYIRRSESYRPRFEEANLERNTLKVKYEKLVAATANMPSEDIDLSAENKHLKDELAKLKAEAAAAPQVDPDADVKLQEALKAANKAEAERSDLQIKYESLLRHNEQLEAAKKSSAVHNFAAPVPAAPVTPPPAPVTPPPAPAAPAAEDDLKKIEGIGPKIEELIKNGGIKTWAALSNTDPSVIQGFLDAAGPRYKMHSPQSWPLQAGMAARGEWEALEKWQDEHDHGKM